MKQPSHILALRVYLPLAMLLLVGGLYGNALFNPLQPEDRLAIVGNPDVAEPGHWTALWTHDELAGETQGPRQYRPVTVASYRLNAAVTGLSPAGFRVVNVVLLGLLGCAAAAWMSTYTGPTAAWLAAFLFVAHPVQTEAVNLISGRATLLALLGVVTFAWLHRRALLKGEGSWTSALAALVAATVAIGANTTGFLVVPVALLQGWLGPQPGPAPQPWWRREQAQTSVGKPPTLRPVHARTALLLALPVAGYALGRTLAVGWDWSMTAPAGEDLTSNPLLGAALAARAAAGLHLAWYYLSQLVAPHPCGNTIPLALPTWHDPATWAGAGVVALALLGAWWTLRKRHWLCLAAVLAGGQYILVTHWLAPAPLYAAVRLVLPMALGAALGVAHLLQKWMARDLRRRALATLPTALVVLAMGITVWLFNAHVRHPEVLGARDLEQQVDNPAAQYCFGQALLHSGRYDDALPWLQGAVELRPTSVQARLGLAEGLLSLGRSAQAQEQYQQVIQMDPQNVTAHMQLARWALHEGEPKVAQEHLQAALPRAEGTPQEALVWRECGRAAAAQGLWQEAAADLDQARRLAPLDPGLEQEWTAARNRALSSPQP